MLTTEKNPYTKNVFLGFTVSLGCTVLGFKVEDSGAR